MRLTPYITQDRAPGDLKDAALELLKLDASLNANIHESLRTPMIHLQRVVNSYFSNKIEGNSALPADLLPAQDDPAGGGSAPDLLEIRHHIKAQVRLAIDPIEANAICTRESIARIHRELYKGLPEEHLRLEVGAVDEIIALVPGETRNRGVKVGHHIPPPAEEIYSYLTWFGNAYRLGRLHGLAPLLAAAGGHHRLLWIHPFIDGNGRAARLFTERYLKVGSLSGCDLWSLSRGFGRDANAYYAALRAADGVRKGSLDGRGELSESGLLRFTEYFITTALEQVSFVSSLLEPHTLNQRIDRYFQMRTCRALLIADGSSLPTLRVEALHLYRSLLEIGAMQYSEIQARLSLGESTTRELLGQMLTEGLIDIDRDGQVSMRLSGHSIPTLFPDLF